MVNKATGVINFAQGEFFMFTGFVGWMLHVQFGLNYPLSFLLAVAVGFAARDADRSHRLPSDREE